MSLQSSTTLVGASAPALVDEIEVLLGYREQQEVDAALSSGEPSTTILSSGPNPQAVAVAAHVSPRAFDLIVNYETGGRPYYERVLKARPIWPKASSGVTIGFGYDLGYVTLSDFQRDWAELIAGLSASQRTALAACVGFHSGKDSTQTMQALVASVSDVTVSWDVSLAVYKARTLPTFAWLTFNALPNCDALNGDCFGVLVSLTFNRGASYSKAQNAAKDALDRYREMRAIKAAMIAKRFADIPAQIKAMTRIWVGTPVETGMRRRRADEAALFLDGLATGAPAVVADASAFATQATIAAAPSASDAVSADTPSDENIWTDVTEDDLTAQAESGLFVGIASVGATWAPDAVQPDYAHLGDGLPRSVPFTLSAADLELLAALNDFNVGALGDTPILFGLRGAGVVKDHGDPGGIVLLDQRPDHILPRCTIGVWNVKARTLAVFPGSTVPNQSAVATFLASGTAGNLLPTGLYDYVCGPHVTKRTTPGCFLLRKPDMSKRVVVVRRSKDDLIYEKTDVVDRCAPGDNIHPAFFSRPTGFSSFGCQTVTGSFKDGAHSGPWAAFRRAAGLTDADGEPGKRFLYMLLTGAEARLASRMRLDGVAGDPLATRRLRRLRAGSSGDASRRLQVRLQLTGPEAGLGPVTVEALHRMQAGQPGAAGSDGIFTPDLDASFDWDVFGSPGA